MLPTSIGWFDRLYHTTPSVPCLLMHPAIMHADVSDVLSMPDASLQPAAREALKVALHAHPCEAATLWLAVAHVAAWQRLPDCVVHRLGYRQAPVVLHWGAAPPVSTNAAVATLLRNAASRCCGCLDLEQALQKVRWLQVHSMVETATVKLAVYTCIRTKPCVSVNSMLRLPPPFLRYSDCCRLSA